MSTTLSKKLAFISVAAGNPDTVRSFYEKFFRHQLCRDLERSGVDDLSRARSTKMALT